MSAEVKRLRTAFSLFETGCDLMRMNLRRRFPDETDEQIRGRLRAWLRGTRDEMPGRPYTFRYPP